MIIEGQYKHEPATVSQSSNSKVLRPMLRTPICLYANSARIEMWWPGILHSRQVSGDLNGGGVWLTPDMRVFILVLNYCVGSEKHKMQTPAQKF